MNILEELAGLARERVNADMERISEAEMHSLALAAGKGGGERFTSALAKPRISFICEIKRASPSKGLIAPDFPYTKIAREYEAAAADCVSCLTEPRYFLGSDEIFREVALLIVSLMGREMLDACLQRCEELGIAALTETHDEAEIRTAVDAGARIIGINNRNLKDFSVDFSNTARLRDLIPADRICVAESGVRGPEDVARLRAVGADAVLIGETLMRAEDKGACLKALKEEA